MCVISILAVLCLPMSFVLNPWTLLISAILSVAVAILAQMVLLGGIAMKFSPEHIGFFLSLVYATFYVCRIIAPLVVINILEMLGMI